jgi:hypothetical protein
MKYILIDRENLTLDLGEKSRKKSVFQIPLEIDRGHLSPIQEEVYYGVLYPDAHAEHKKKHPDYEKKGIRVAFSLVEPDPWLIALGYIMWQGIVQGLSWDIVKISIQKALDKLSSFGSAPTNFKIQNKTSKVRQVGFSWTKYGTDEKKQYEMFLGLKSSYENKSERKRNEIEKSKVKAISK